MAVRPIQLADEETAFRAQALTFKNENASFWILGSGPETCLFPQAPGVDYESN
jgi:hypothetical protein